MRDVEQRRLPGPPKHPLIRAGSKPVCQGCKFFHRREQTLHVPHPLFEFYAATVDSLEKRIAFAGEDRQIGSPGCYRFKVRRHTNAQREWHVILPIEFLYQARHIELRLGYIETSEPYAV